MEVSEEEFQSLKVEQSILVDFHQFPDKFIELLEECVSSRGEANPRFLAVLRLGDTLQLVALRRPRDALLTALRSSRSCAPPPRTNVSRRSSLALAPARA